MKQSYIFGLTVLLLAGSSVPGRCALVPQNVGVTFNGETDAIDPLAAGEWHTISARLQGGG